MSNKKAEKSRQIILLKEKFAVELFGNVMVSADNKKTQMVPFGNSKMQNLTTLDNTIFKILSNVNE